MLLLQELWMANNCLKLFLSTTVWNKFKINFLVVLYRHSTVTRLYRRFHRCLLAAIFRFPLGSIGEFRDSMTRVPVAGLVYDLHAPQLNPTPNSADQCCRTHSQFLFPNRKIGMNCVYESISIVWIVILWSDCSATQTFQVVVVHLVSIACCADFSCVCIFWGHWLATLQRFLIVQIDIFDLFLKLLLLFGCRLAIRHYFDGLQDSCLHLHINPLSRECNERIKKKYDWTANSWSWFHMPPATSDSGRPSPLAVDKVRLNWVIGFE